VPAELWGKQFRSQNLISKYPFDDNAQLITSDGLIFASDAIIDASLYIIGNWTNVALTSITNSFTQATLWFGNKAEPKAASVSLDLTAIPSSVDIVDTLGRPAGLLILNPTSIVALQVWPNGTHNFPDGTANFVVSALVPTPEVGVLGINVGGILFTNNVWLSGEFGVIFTQNSSQMIVVNIIGEPLSLRSACLASGSFTTPAYLQTINGIGPNAYGGFLLAAAGISLGDTILRIEPSGTDTLNIYLAGPSG